MKRLFALLLAIVMLFALCACSGEVEDTPVQGGTQTQTPVTDDNVGADEPVEQPGEQPGEEPKTVTAIGVANPYIEITAVELYSLFGVSVDLPIGASGAYYFDIDTGGDTHMLQLQFMYEDVQYILRGKSAARLTNISAAYANWDSQESCDISGCEGQIYLSSGGAGAVLWYDSISGFTYALSAGENAQKSTLLSLAQTIYVPGSAADVPADTQPDEDTGGDTETPAAPTVKEIQVRVYYPASDGVSFAYVTFTTAEASAEYLISKLIGLGVLPSNVSAQWVEGMAIDEAGNIELALSLSPSFGTYLKSLDAKEEHMVMGCIVNTFLDAHDAVRIWVYVDGNDPVSATRTYDRALTRYSRYDPSALPETETGDGTEEGQDEDTPAPDAGDVTLAQRICDLANSKAGSAYVYGGAGPDTFDNSGLVYYCFKENGITIPRRTTEMYQTGTPVDYDDLQPGDVVFFTYEDDRSPSYVGIYLGEGKFIAANREGVPVTVMDITTQYFQDIYIGARRYT